MPRVLDLTTSRVHPRYMTLDASSHSFKEDLRFMCAMLQIPESRRALYLATCAHCGPILMPQVWDLSLVDPTCLQFADLNPHCTVCNVIHQAFYSFSRGNLMPDSLWIGHGRTDGDLDHLPVDFTQYSEDIARHIQQLHVQLYSEVTQLYVA